MDEVFKKWAEPGSSRGALAPPPGRPGFSTTPNLR